MATSKIDMHKPDLKLAMEIEELLVQCGFDPASFEVLVTARYGSDNVAMYPINEAIHVQGPGSVHRVYRSGHMTTWPADFERDLRSGVFGNP